MKFVNARNHGKLLVRRYEHEEEMTGCIVVMLFELVITLIGVKFTRTEKGIFLL